MIWSQICRIYKYYKKLIVVLSIVKFCNGWYQRCLKNDKELQKIYFHGSLMSWQTWLNYLFRGLKIIILCFYFEKNYLFTTVMLKALSSQVWNRSKCFSFLKLYLCTFAYFLHKRSNGEIIRVKHILVIKTMFSSTFLINMHCQLCI